MMLEESRGSVLGRGEDGWVINRKELELEAACSGVQLHGRVSIVNHDVLCTSAYREERI